MDQAELNAAVQKWLEALLQPEVSQLKPVSPNICAESQDLSLVLEKLKQLLKLEEMPRTSLRAGGTHLAVLARSVGAYLHVALSSADIDRAARQLSLQTTKTLMSMFKLTGKKLTPCYHDDPKEGLARVMQMALFAKYEKYAINGCSEFHEKAPVFYVSDAGQVSHLHNTLGKFGIPQSSCSLIPCGPDPHSINTMNTEALEEAIAKDMSDGRVPVMVIAHAGTPVTGHVEDMWKIRQVTSKHEMWMHVQGHAISSLCLSSDTEDREVAACRDGDSMTLCPGTWFGLLSCPYLTLHKTPYVIDTDEMEDQEGFPPADMAVPEGCVPVPRCSWSGMLPGGLARLVPLSLWLCLQYLGTNALQETVSYCHNLTQHMIGKLGEVPGVRRLDVPSHQSFVVLFKYLGGGEIEFQPLVPSEEEAGLEQEATPTMIVEELDGPTCNVANAMIARDLQAHFTKVGISPLKLPHHGVCFKFDPINSFPEHSTSLEDVDKFIAALQYRVSSLHTTALARKLIETQLKGQPNLRCLEFPSFFGSGFIQFVPTDWATKTELSLEEVNELNKMNIELSESLAAKNPVFAAFQHGNFSCIMIKELTAETNLREFLLYLLEEARSYEEDKRFLQDVSQKIIEGIQSAQSDLHKEKEQKEQEEGLLRNLPLVGSVWSWFSPSSPATPQGRQFDLTSGKVETTEGTYKYKMQVLEGKSDDQLDTTTNSDQTTSEQTQAGTPDKGEEPVEQATPTQSAEEVQQTGNESLEQQTNDGIN